MDRSRAARAEHLRNLCSGSARVDAKGNFEFVLDLHDAAANLYWLNPEIRLFDTHRSNVGAAFPSIETEWPLERASRIGDQATDGQTLTELYGKMASQPFVVDLGYLWGQLGVSENGQGIVLDDRARWADIREDHLRRCKKEKVRTMTEMKIEPRQVSLSTSEASLSAQVLIDRPQEKGGADRGPMGGELFLASIGGCFMSNLLAAINARKADISEVRTEVTGKIAEARSNCT